MNRPQQQGLEIVQIKLKSHRRSSEPQWLDLIEYYSSFELIEDIFSNCLYGTLILKETHNIVSSPIDKTHTVGPIIGNEEIHIIVREKKNRKELKLIMNVYKISNRFLDNTKAQVSVINLVSQEMISDSTICISKSYRNKKYSAIVTDILQNDIKTKKRINIYETDVPKNLIIPGWGPFKTINWIASKSISANYRGASFLFFETINFEGNLQPTFHFIPLEELYTRSPSKRLRTTIANISEDINSNERINAYSFQKTFDIIENITSGMYANCIVGYDILNKKFKNFNFNYLEEYPTLKHLQNSGRLVSKLTAPFVNKFDSNFTLYTFNNSHYEGKFQDESSLQYIPFRKSQLQQLNNIKINVVIPADPSLSVGDIIDLQITSPKNTADINSVSETLDKYYKGKFIITCVRHVINNEAPNYGVYSMILELSKDTLEINPLMESEIG